MKLRIDRPLRVCNYMPVIPRLCFAMFCVCACSAQQPLFAPPSGSTLERVVIVARHGVRSPLQTNEKLAKYSRDPWPAWPVAPGFLTPHGRALMSTLGTFYAQRYRDFGVLQGQGCQSARDVYVWSDTDERDVSTAQSFLQGLLPGCTVPIHRLPDGVNDPVIHALKEEGAQPDRSLAVAEVLGRVGGDPQSVVDAEMPALLTLDRVLGGCGRTLCPGEPAGRVVVPSMPAKLKPGTGDHLLDETNSPLDLGATLSEIFVLQYADGKPMNEVGFGRASRADLTEMLSLHTVHFDLDQETDYPARFQGTPLLMHVLEALEGASGSAPAMERAGFQTAGARFVYIAAHDSNIAQIAGMLHLHWYLPSEAQDSIPPGSALVFELRRRADGSRFVQLRFIAQSLEQLRENTSLTPAHAPSVVPVTLPDCTSLADGSGCPMPQFEKYVKSRLLPQFVTAP